MNRLGGGNQLVPEEPEETPDESSVIMRGDNLPMIEINKYNTDGKKANYIQINHIEGNLTANKKATEENIEKAAFECRMDLNTLVSKTHHCQRQYEERMARKPNRTDTSRYSTSYQFAGASPSSTFNWYCLSTSEDGFYTTLRPLCNDKDGDRSKNFVMAREEKWHRNESQGLHFQKFKIQISEKTLRKI